MAEVTKIIPTRAHSPPLSDTNLDALVIIKFRSIPINKGIKIVRNAPINFPRRTVARDTELDMSKLNVPVSRSPEIAS